MPNNVGREQCEECGAWCFVRSSKTDGEKKVKYWQCPECDRRITTVEER